MKNLELGWAVPLACQVVVLREKWRDIWGCIIKLLNGARVVVSTGPLAMGADCVVTVRVVMA